MQAGGAELLEEQAMHREADGAPEPLVGHGPGGVEVVAVEGAQQQIGPHGPMIALVAPPARSRRTVGARLLAGPALGQLGPLSIWTFPLVYLVVPLVAAYHLKTDGREAFLRDEVPRLAQGLGWVLTFQAWAFALVDRFPLPDERSVLTLDAQPSSPPGALRALARLLTGLPMGLVLWLAGAAALPLWLASQGSLLALRRVPGWIGVPLRALLSANARFLVAHASVSHSRNGAGARRPPYGAPVSEGSAALTSRS